MQYSHTILGEAVAMLAADRARWEVRASPLPSEGIRPASDSGRMGGRLFSDAAFAATALIGLGGFESSVFLNGETPDSGKIPLASAFISLWRSEDWLFFKGERLSACAKSLTRDAASLGGCDIFEGESAADTFGTVGLEEPAASRLPSMDKRAVIPGRWSEGNFAFISALDSLAAKFDEFM